jgi:hypothetical protein
MSELRKPPHVFALVLWCSALLYGAVFPLITIYFYSQIGPPAGSAHRLAFAIWTALRDGTEVALELAAAGFIITLLDYIRWRLTPEGELAGLHRTYLASRARALVDYTENF